MPNNMTGSKGGFCNHVIRALACSFLAKQRNLRFHYGEFWDKMNALGIELFTQGELTFHQEQEITDDVLMTCLRDQVLFPYDLRVFESFFQNKWFANYLYQHFQQPTHQQSICSANKFQSRYHHNNDLFVHVRLTDMAHNNQGFAYYDKGISSIQYDTGYISSDDIHHDICQQLIAKYGLTVIDYNDVETIMFGSTCQHVMVTGGSYSFIIALFSFFSNVYYLKGMNIWYPAELFHVDAWKEIDV
jgi:hypothetical protein